MLVIQVIPGTNYFFYCWGSSASFLVSVFPISLNCYPVYLRVDNIQWLFLLFFFRVFLFPLDLGLWTCSTRRLSGIVQVGDLRRKPSSCNSHLQNSFPVSGSLMSEIWVIFFSPFISMMLIGHLWGFEKALQSLLCSFQCIPFQSFHMLVLFLIPRGVVMR